MSDTFADDQSGSESPGTALACFVVSVSGLTANPTYGQTAQISVPLYASAHNFSETAPASVAWQWRDSNGDIAGATSAAYTPAVGDNLETIHPVATPSGAYAPRGGPAYMVRFAPPLVTGILHNVNFSKDTGDKTVATAGNFTGNGLTYSVNTSLPGVSIDSGTGLVTIPTGSDANGVVTVTARNSGGSIQGAFNVSVATAATAPATMSAPTVSATGASSLKVELAAAPDDGGSVISSYDMRWRENGGTWATVKGISNPETLTGLKAATLYKIRTRAVNAIGYGVWSTAAPGWTDPPAATLPEIVTNAGDTVDIVVGDGTFTVTITGSSYTHQNGTWGPFNTADLDAGPVNVVAASITGTAGTGEVLTAAPGVWVYDTADGATTIAPIWQRDNVEISGETGATYTTVVGDEGTSVTYQETATNSAGARSQDSNGIAIPSVSSLAVSRIGDFHSDNSSTITPSYIIDLTGAVVGDIIVLLQGTGKNAASATVGGNSATKITTDISASASNRMSAFEYTVGAGEAGNGSVTVQFTLDATTNQHLFAAHLVKGGVVDEAVHSVNESADAPKSVAGSVTPTDANNYILACMMGGTTFTTPGDETWTGAALIASDTLATGSTRDISIAGIEGVAAGSTEVSCNTPLAGKTGIIVVAISEVS